VRILLLLIPAIAAAEPPTPVVTKAFMRQIADGKIKPAELVDPTVGVLAVRYTSGEYEPPETKSAFRLCGADAATAIKRIVRDHLKTAISLDEDFSCTNRPRPTCIAGIAGEWSTRNAYVFRPNPDGKLMLDTIITTNAAYNPADEARVIARLRAKHLGGTCP
jgi:hypothetical protein